jgi:hypothetical protein
MIASYRVFLSKKARKPGIKNAARSLRLLGGLAANLAHTEPYSSVGGSVIRSAESMTHIERLLWRFDGECL